VMKWRRGLLLLWALLSGVAFPKRRLMQMLEVDHS
jgi:hypothetical protein